MVGDLGHPERASAHRQARCAAATPEAISIDETGFPTCREYASVISREDRVEHFGKGRQQAVLEEWYRGQDQSTLSGLRIVVIVMWARDSRTTRAFVTDAERRIGFDRFHVAHRLNHAVAKIR